MGLGRQEGDVAKATLPVGSSDAQRLRLQSLWTSSRGQGNVVCGRDIIVFSPHVFWEWLGRRGLDKFYGFYSSRSGNSRIRPCVKVHCPAGKTARGATVQRYQTPHEDTELGTIVGCRGVDLRRFVECLCGHPLTYRSSTATANNDKC